jgi:hypothetical protein
MRVVAFDLDGTLSSSRWRQELADRKLWHGYHELLQHDAPIPAVVAAFNACDEEGYDTVIFTARGGSAFQRAVTLTWNWLEQHDIMPTWGVSFRQPDDYRPGPAVKQDMVRELADHGIRVVRAWDDQIRFKPAYAEVGVAFEHVIDPDIPPPALSPAQIQEILANQLVKGV